MSFAAVVLGAAVAFVLALATVGGLLLMWGLRTYVDFFTFS
jgi:hypothetical protein